MREQEALARHVDMLAADQHIVIKALLDLMEDFDKVIDEIGIHIIAIQMQHHIFAFGFFYGNIARKAKLSVLVPLKFQKPQVGVFLLQAFNDLNTTICRSIIG